MKTALDDTKTAVICFASYRESSDLIPASLSSEGMRNWNISVIEISVGNVYGLVINDVIILFEIATESASRAADSLLPRLTNIQINLTSKFITL